MAEVATEATPEATQASLAQDTSDDWPGPESAAPLNLNAEGTGISTPPESTESVKDAGAKSPGTHKTRRGGKKDKETKSPGPAGADSNASPNPKAKKEAPYVNPNRVQTGGAQRDKLTEEELKERMQRIRLNNEKIKERRAAVQADEKAFEAVNAVQRAKQARQRRVQDTINADRAANARRKMDKISGREWDAEKGGAGGGQQQQQEQQDNAEETTDVVAGDDGWAALAAAAAEEFPDPAVSSEAPEGTRGRGRGRGAARGERGRGKGRGRSRAERDKAPHLKDEPQPENPSAAEWGAEVEAAIEGTGIAITTNENDEDDGGWGNLKDQDDPWSNL